jgi:hypothetical protein
VLFFADANQEVVGLDISVQEVTRVHKLDSLKLKIKCVRFQMWSQGNTNYIESGN